MLLILLTRAIVDLRHNRNKSCCYFIFEIHPETGLPISGSNQRVRLQLIPLHSRPAAGLNTEPAYENSRQPEQDPLTLSLSPRGRGDLHRILVQKWTPATLHASLAP